MARLRRPPRDVALDATEHAWVLKVAREGAAPRAPLRAGALAGGELRVAVVIPPFRRGSGGHATIAHVARGLRDRGHAVQLWLHDPAGVHARDEVAALFGAFFGDVGEPVRPDLDGFAGADVVLATGWQTVHRAVTLPGASARAYLVQDHEPEFYGTSAERIWAEETYGLGLHAITAGTWLADLVRERYGATADSFDLGVDHSVYRLADGVRRQDAHLVFYARVATPRRGVALGLLALEEIHARHPDLQITVYGDPREVRASFPLRHAGVLAPAALADLYRQATVGLVLSLTNHSLIPLEMLACGLPCVDLDHPSTRAALGPAGPAELAAADPLALAAAVGTLLDKPAERRRRSQAGVALVAGRTWQHAAEQVEAGLREALTVRT